MTILAHLSRLSGALIGAADLSPPSRETQVENTFITNRKRLKRFLLARGAGDSVECLLSELWLRSAGDGRNPVILSLSQLFRIADGLMVEYNRSGREGLRKHERSKQSAGASPCLLFSSRADAPIFGPTHVGLVTQTLDSVSERAAEIFYCHRIDGAPQRVIAEELGVGLNVVERELALAYAALTGLSERLENGGADFAS